MMVTMGPTAHCSSDLPTPGSVDTLVTSPPPIPKELPLKSGTPGYGNNIVKVQLPYHFEFVKVSILLSIGLYMALSGFLAYMFIRQQVDKDVENMDQKFMANFLTFLACFFFIAEIILFFGFVAVSKENLSMAAAFAGLMTILTVITLFLGEPTAIVFTGMITCLSWWYVVLLRQTQR